MALFSFLIVYFFIYRRDLDIISSQMPGVFGMIMCIFFLFIFVCKQMCTPYVSISVPVGDALRLRPCSEKSQLPTMTTELLASKS
jgi:hypothetical protein